MNLLERASPVPSTFFAADTLGEGAPAGKWVRRFKLSATEDAPYPYSGTRFSGRVSTYIVVFWRR